MSRSVENYGIQMEFDNKDFEKGVGQTLSTLDRLKKKLNFDGASKGLEDLGNAAEKVNFDPMSNAVDGIKNGFSALEVVATGALLKIGARVEELGEKLLRTATAMSALNPTNILTGWEKFGDKTTAVGTLVAQGNDIDHVNEQLSKLQWFTDETSYQFTEMVANIAKFTAAGQDLDGSVVALEGIANWAAMSGQNAQTASRAMYQLSQAMGKGVMRLDDWKSIQNASMDTDQFREKVIETAIRLGTLEKVGDDTYNSLVANADEFSKAQFTTALTEGQWFTSDVMMDVFRQYAAAVEPIYAYVQEHDVLASEAIEEMTKQGLLDEFAVQAFRAAQEARTFKDTVDSVKEAVQTGWSNIFETIFGDYEEAKTLWTDLANTLYDVFAEPLNGVNQLLSGGLSSGWKRFLKEGIPNAEEFKETLIYVARDSGVAIDDLIKESGSLANSFKEGWLTADILSKAVDTMSETYSNLTEEQKATLGIYDYQVEELVRLNTAFKDGTISVEEWTTAISDTSGRDLLIRSLFNIFDALFAVDEETGKALGLFSILSESFWKVFSPITSDNVFSLAQKIETLTEKLKPNAVQVTQLGRIFEGLFSILRIAKTTFEKAYNALSTLLSGIFGDVNFDLLEFAAGIGDAITNFSKWYESTSLLADGFSSITGEIGGLATMVQTYASWLSEGITTVASKIQEIASGIASFVKENVGLKNVLAILFSGGLLLGAKAIFNWLPDAISTLIDLADVLDIEYNMAKAKSVLIFAGALLVLVGAISLLALIPVERLGYALGAIAALAAGLVGFVFLLERINSFKGKDVFERVLGGATSVLNGLATSFQADAVIKISVAILVLSGALTVLTLLPVDRLWSSIGAIAALAGILGIFMAVMTKMSAGGTDKFLDRFSGIFSSFAASMKGDLLIKTSLSLLILSGAVTALSLIPADRLWASIGAIAALAGVLGLLIAALNSTAGGKMQMVTLSMVIGSVSLLVISLAGALRLISSIDFEQSKFTILSFAGILTLLTIAVLILGKFEAGKGATIRGALAIIAIGVAIKSIAKAFLSINELDMDTIGEKILAVGIFFAALEFLIGAMPKGAFGSAIGMLVAVTALKLFINAIQDIMAFDFETIKSKMPILAVVFGALTVLFVIIKKTGTESFKAAASIFALGATAVLFGKMIDLLAGALAKLRDDSALDLAKKAAVLGAFVVSFAFIMRKISDVEQKGSGKGTIKSILLIVGTLAALSVLMHIMSAMDVEKMIPAALSLSALMLALGYMVKSVEWANTKTIAMLAVAAVVAAMLGFVLFKIAEIGDQGALLAATGSLAVVFLSFAGILFALSFLTKVSENLDWAALGKVLLEFLGITTIITVFVAILNSIEINEGLTEKVLAFSAIAVVCAGVAIALSLIGGAINVGVIGQALLGIAVFLAGMAAILGIIGGIVNWIGADRVNEALDEAVAVATKIGEAIGRFVGAIVGGLVDEAVFKQIENFADSMVNFSETMATFNMDSVEKAKAAVGLFALFGASSFVSGLATFAADVIDVFDTTIYELSHNGESKNKFQRFAENLKTLGEGLKDFDQSLGSEFRSYSVKSASEALPPLFDAIRNVPGTDGIESFLKTDGNGDTVLAKLAKGLAAFHNELKDGINPSLVKEAMTALGYVVEFAKSLPNEGGLLGGLVGDNNLDVFASYLPAFADGISGFVEKIQAINLSGMDFDSLGLLMTEFERWIGFARSIVGIDISRLPSFAEVLINTAKTGIDGFLNKITENFETVYEKTGEFMRQAISGINDKAPDMALAMNAMVLTMTLALGSEENIAKFYEAGSNAAQGFIDGLESRIDDVREAAERLGEAANEGLSVDALDERSPSHKWFNYGELGGEGLVGGLMSMVDNVKSAATKLGESATEGITNGVSGIKDVIQNGIGEVDFSNGVVNGLKDAAGNLKEYFLKKSGIGDLDMTKLLGADFTAPNIDLNSLGAEGLTPVLDLNNAIEQAGNLDNLMSFWQASGIDNAFKEQELAMEDYQNGINPFGTTYNFTQNNYSPKALSREEIYRQTRNQFALMKGSVR